MAEMIYIDIPAPVLGLSCALPSTMIDNRATPDCQNIKFGFDYFEKRAGNNQLGDTKTVTSGDSPVEIVDYSTGGTQIHTLYHSYRWTSNNTWTDITDAGGLLRRPQGGASILFGDTVIVTSGYASTDAKCRIKMSSGTSTLEDLTGATSYVASAIETLGSRVLINSLLENTGRTLRWSVAGSAIDWSGTGAGFVILNHQLRKGAIHAMKKLGNIVVIYGERSILLCEYTDNVSSPFALRVAYDKEGIFCPKAVIAVGDAHYYMSKSGIFVYSGGLKPEPIDVGIRKRIFNQINTSEAILPMTRYIYTSYDSYTDEIFFSFPTKSLSDITNKPEDYYSYNLLTKAWSYGKSTTILRVRNSSPIAAFGRWQDDSTYWDDSVGTWNQYLTRYNAFDKPIEAAPATTAAPTSLLIWQGELGFNDKGSAIDAWLDTKDFTGIAPEDSYRKKIKHWQELSFEGQGHGVHIYFSTDGGITYNLLQDITMSEHHWSYYTINFSVKSPMIRFRFRNAETSETFAIRQYSVGYQTGSEVGV